jgi:hypothetical protein
MPVDRNAPLEDFERIAGHFPVFRIEPRQPADDELGITG